MKTAIYGWILALGIANHALANDVANSRHATQLIRQNINLYQIDKKLFRSQQLHANDLPTIQSLGIKSMVNLRYFNRMKMKNCLQINLFT